MTKPEYEAAVLNANLWSAVRALDMDISKLPADYRSSLLNMQVALREIAWGHLQSLKIEWAAGEKSHD